MILLASSSTLDGIAAMVNQYYCTTAYSLVPNGKRWDVESSKGKRDNVFIERKAGRYRFMLMTQ